VDALGPSGGQNARYSGDGESCGLTCRAVSRSVLSKETVFDTKSIAASEAPGRMSFQPFGGKTWKRILPQSG